LKDGENDEASFNQLGFGVVAYLRMLKTMMYMFLIFSLLMAAPIFMFQR